MPSSKTNLPHLMEAEDTISNNLRVASFSWYLNNSEESIVPELAGSMQDPHSSPEPPFPVSSGRVNALIGKPTSNTNLVHSINSQDNITNRRVADKFVFKVPGAVHNTTSESPCSIILGRSKPKEGEIGVFGADKYFNMKTEYDKRTNRGNEKEGCADDLHHVKPNFKLKTRSIISETISLNSQTVLLSNYSNSQRNPSQIKETRAIGKRFFSSLGCNGCCFFYKKGVYISTEHGGLHRTKQSQAGLNRGEKLQFESQVLDPGMENLQVKNQYEEEKKEEEEQRKSLDVFRSDTMKKGDVASNLERKLSILTWDAIPKAHNLPKTSFGSSTLCDDMASDASSDLFEIESISHTGQLMTRSSSRLVNNFSLTRQASENMSSCTSPTTPYAPSEASIEWSVVTTSAADLSVASDFENVKNGCHSKAEKTRNLGGKEAQKTGPGGLLSCRSHKTVRVAESLYKSTDKAKQGTLDSSD